MSKRSISKYGFASVSRFLFTRLTGAIGLCVLALLLVGLYPFVGSDLTSGAGLSSLMPSTSVVRDLKGERYPSVGSTRRYAPDWDAVFNALPQPQSQQAPKPHAEIRVGCDPAFSPITSPVRYNVYGRCMA